MVKLAPVIVIVAVAILAIVLVQNFTGAYTYVSCTDSDGGKNYAVKGTAIATTDTGQGKMTMSDVCKNRVISGKNYNLEEKYCGNDKRVQWVPYNCPSGCKDGACIVPCIDSDGGANYTTKGTVTNSSGVFVDSCSAINEWWRNKKNWLNEFVCAGTQGGGPFDCTAQRKFCYNGACTDNSQCSDTDGPWDTITQGTMTNITGQYTDYCIDANWLSEFECDMDNAEHWFYGAYQLDCKTKGKVCKNGACI